MNKEILLVLVLLLILSGLVWSFVSNQLLIPFILLFLGFILLLITIFTKE
ncbi:MAG: hypothetical protein LUF85_03060 [Bacteroides sp.]|nr:hypothetical protein [Bacteroides sp.]